MRKIEERRKRYYIGKKFQRDFILRFCALVVLGALLSGIIVYVMSTSTVTTTFENSRLVIKSTAEYILPLLLLSSAIVIILVGIATIFITLFTSHKISGALYRMEIGAGEIASGNLTAKLNLRRQDQIKPLAVSLEVMTQTLRTRISRIKKICSELERISISAEVKDEVLKLRKELDSFITE
ncbi:MAG: methyl-accepting chemotaxis protein [Candidatus Omnitrophica bacterium]|nr:methyl-accepting chemotaxis protein [Candidatus Omnitrophota bacterium]